MRMASFFMRKRKMPGAVLRRADSIERTSGEERETGAGLWRGTLAFWKKTKFKKTVCPESAVQSGGIQLIFGKASMFRHFLGSIL